MLWLHHCIRYVWLRKKFEFQLTDHLGRNWVVLSMNKWNEIRNVWRLSDKNVEINKKNVFKIIIVKFRIAVNFFLMTSTSFLKLLGTITSQMQSHHRITFSTPLSSYFSYSAKGHKLDFTDYHLKTLSLSHSSI